MELKCLTFNIRYDIASDGPNRWPHRRDSVLELVRNTDPDIVGFQEALPHQRWELERGLPNYRLIGRGRESDAGGEQCAIAFKPWITLLECNTFWLSPSPSQAGSIGWDAMLTRICTYARLCLHGREVTVFNAHFDHHGQEAPVRSAELILEQMKALEHPHLLMGDFNSTPQSVPLVTLGRKLRDSLAEFSPLDQSGTYHEFGTLKQLPRIDYLMLSSHWEILDCRVLSQSHPPYPSDHFAVLGHYRLNDE